MVKKPKVIIIGTGGTIAGRAAVATDLSYNAAELSIDELILEVPGLNNLADISTINLFALNSKDMGPVEWLKLALTVQAYAEDPNISGIVVTHGTDTLEETALFLELTLTTRKPVVITGSMRASTALSADGPSNLYQAVQVSATRSSKGRGVLVVFNGEIFSGSRVAKGHSINTSAFAITASGGGLIGSVYSGHTFFFVPKGFSTHHGAFHEVLTNSRNLPHVGVHYVTAGGNDSALIALTTDCTGLVVAALGGGEIPEILVPKLLTLATGGLPIIVSSRVPNVVVMPETMTLKEGENVVASRHLNPQKSAVFLALVLATGNSPADVFARLDTST